MTNPDTLNAATVAVVMLATLVCWITLDLRRRRIDKARTIHDVLTTCNGVASSVAAGECAHVWHDHRDGFHVCIRSYDHTAPHLCGIHGEACTWH